MANKAKHRKNKRLRQHLAAIVFVLLATTALFALPKMFPPLPGLGKAVLSTTRQVREAAAEGTHTPHLPRGTIYDRNYMELATSYQLFTLYREGNDQLDPEQVASDIAPIVNEERAVLAAKLHSRDYPVKLAENLEEEQAAAIDRLDIPGLSCEAGEVRHYPWHTTAAHLIGFTENNVGLAGVEALYDAVLQPGEFTNPDVPELDFQGTKTLGRSISDIVLTIDIELQKDLEKRLRSRMESLEIESAMAMILDPAKGAISAMTSLPTFNPNYFWQVEKENRQNNLLQESLSLDLIRPLLARAAAVAKDEEASAPPPPATVSTPSFGLIDAELMSFYKKIGLGEDMFTDMPSCIHTALDQPSRDNYIVTSRVVSGMQLATTVAGLINGGWCTPPYFLDSIYDHNTSRSIGRSRQYEATIKSRMVPPATGIRIRRELSNFTRQKGQNYSLYTASSVKIHHHGALSEYAIQDIILAWTPPNLPSKLLIIAGQRTHLAPELPRANNDSLAALGEELLSLPLQEGGGNMVAVQHPDTPDRENYDRFLISRRLNITEYQKPVSDPCIIMPAVTGLSLRKGLQRLNKQKHNLKIRIEGSGRIVAQTPAAGTPVARDGECVLTLESNI